MLNNPEIMRLVVRKFSNYTHDLDKNYILLNNNNVECVLSKLSN